MRDAPNRIGDQFAEAIGQRSDRGRFGAAGGKAAQRVDEGLLCIDRAQIGGRELHRMLLDAETAPAAISRLRQAFDFLAEIGGFGSVLYHAETLGADTATRTVDGMS